MCKISARLKSSSKFYKTLHLQQKNIIYVHKNIFKLNIKSTTTLPGSAHVNRLQFFLLKKNRDTHFLEKGYFFNNVAPENDGLFAGCETMFINRRNFASRPLWDRYILVYAPTPTYFVDFLLGREKQGGAKVCMRSK